MKMLSAPFKALYDRAFYARAAHAGAGKGLIYILYLSAIMLAGALISVQTRLLPEANRFVEWLQVEMPVLQWAPQGLSMKGATAYALVHPEYGPLAQFDMERGEITREDMGPNSIFVTSQKIYMRQPGTEELREYDITQLAGAGAPAEPFEVRPENIGTFYREIKPWLAAGLLASIFGIFILWKLLAALFYSWIALLINMMRQEKLYYSHLWTVTCFALTPAALIQTLQFALPPLAAIPFGPAGSFALTVLYLFLAVKGTEPASPAAA